MANFCHSNKSRSRTFEYYGIHLPFFPPVTLRTTCPRCSAGRKKKTQKCLSVDRGTGIWHCFHCGRSGTLWAGWSDDRLRTGSRAQRASWARMTRQRTNGPSGPGESYGWKEKNQNRRTSGLNVTSEHDACSASTSLATFGSSTTASIGRFAALFRQCWPWCETLVGSQWRYSGHF